MSKPSEIIKKTNKQIDVLNKKLSIASNLSIKLKDTLNEINELKKAIGIDE